MIPLLLLSVPLATNAAPDFAAPSAPPRAAEIGLDRATVRRRPVTLAVEGLENRRDLTLELFDGEVLRVAREDVRRAPGGHVWTGKVLGDKTGQVVLSAVGEAVAGTIDVGDKLFQVRWAGEGKHWIQESDTTRYPSCGTQHLGVEVRPGPTGGALAATASPVVIDVMVAYTPAALAAEGGDAAMLARINLAVTQANQAFTSSLVDQRLRLVRWGEAQGYVEPVSFSAMLAELTDPTDGQMDELHAWRDQSGADTVTLLCVNRQYCGAANQMSAVNAAFEKQAFNVVNHTCATSIFTFAHELGHTCGSTHDPANAGPSVFPYGRGYRTPDSRRRTIMAYAPGTRAKLFSNPAITFKGYVMGSATEDNARSLNQTAATVAAFRSDLPTLAISSLRRGTIGTFDVSLLSPGGIGVVAYSTVGGGPFKTVSGTLELTPPVALLATVVADANGQATYAQLVPAPPGAFAQVWFQAFDLTKAELSNGVKRTIF